MSVTELQHVGRDGGVASEELDHFFGVDAEVDAFAACGTCAVHGLDDNTAHLCSDEDSIHFVGVPEDGMTSVALQGLARGDWWH